MSLAFISHYDSTNVRSWSGVPYFMLNGMRTANLEPEIMGPLCEKLIFPFRFRAKVQRQLMGKAYLWERDPVVLNALAREAGRRLRGSKASVAFSPGTIALARLQCSQPLVFWTDMLFESSLDFYIPRAEVSAQSIRRAHESEQAALDRAALAIFSSDWARDAVLARYKVDPARVKTIPFGSNVIWEVSEEEVSRLILARSRDVCHLAFIGVDWKRKGGAFALKVAKALEARGIPTRVTIVGCEPQEPVGSNVALHRFLDKGTPEGRTSFQTILGEAHFLILPTSADCTPMVIGEANSLGVPCIATNVGGIPSQIRADINGRTFSLSDPPEVWADYVEELHADPDRYALTAMSSFREYHARLCWGASIRSFQAALADSGLLPRAAGVQKAI